MHLIFLYPYKAEQKEDIDTSARDPNLVYILTENHRLHVLRATQPVRQKSPYQKKMCTRNRAHIFYHFLFLRAFINSRVIIPSG